MTEIVSEARFAATEPKERVLLVSQCLRPSQTCPGKFSREGLNCPQDCTQECVIGRLRGIALELGYNGVCIAAGGAMAVRFVKERRPKGIVAIACPKELEEGVAAVAEMSRGNSDPPAIVTVPLLRDGCVDTEVDVDQALRAIHLLSIAPEPK